jgi:hypothetical protein
MQVNKECNHRMQDIFEACKRLGLVADGSLLSALPYDYGKPFPRLADDKRFTFTAIPR